MFYRYKSYLAVAAFLACLLLAGEIEWREQADKQQYSEVNK